MKIALTITAPNCKSYKERLKYLSAIYGTTEKYGFIKKFNDAIGYKNVSYYTSTPSGGRLIEPVIPTPTTYTPPKDILFKNIEFWDKEFEICTIIVENEYITHPDNKYSYNTLNILFKFIKFIKKVLPQINTSLSIIDSNYKAPLTTFAISYFTTCYAYSDNCNMEFSSHRMFTSEEKKEILKTMKKIVDFEPDIYQDYCETCYKYHKDAPYHTELIKIT